MDADYCALGHWDVHAAIPTCAVPAYYSGSPDIARTINVATFGEGRIDVRREPAKRFRSSR